MSLETQKLRTSILSYLALARRLTQHKRLIGAIFVGGALLSLLVAFVIPPVYQSSTLILVQAQRVPSSYVQSSISVDLGERLRTLTPQIMSRAKLETIIQKFELFGVSEDPRDLEGKVDRMRASIDVQVKGEDTFRIYFSHRSPETARKVTHELARLFIEENLRDRAQQAENTSEFIDGELFDLKKQLEAQEADLRKYKESHMGVLPEQQNANLRALDRLQLQYQSVSEALENARNRKMAIEGELTKDGGDGLFAIPSEPTLDRMRSDLADLRARYTDRHPDVRELARKIDEMEKKLVAMRETGQDPAAQADPFTRNQMGKLAQANRDVAQLEQQMTTIQESIQKFQGRIERLPEVEQRMILLTRDYETTQRNYQALLNKKFEARMSVNLEKKQKDAAFKILDPAYLPAKPARPKRMLILLAGLFASLAAGFAAAFVLESLDNTVRSEADLANVSKFPVLTVIPTLGGIRPEPEKEPIRAAGP